VHQVEPYRGREPAGEIPSLLL